MKLGGWRARSETDPAVPVVCQAASLCLAYPEAALLERLDVIAEALAPTWAAPMFAPVLAHLRGTVGDGQTSRLAALQSVHIQEFDLSRRHSLHLSYWTDGDTRRRGQVLAEVKQAYRDSGLVVSTGGELPDYLPIMLEFAVADPERGLALLQRFRASLELLRIELDQDGLPHAGVVAAVCRLLPGESPTTRAEVQAMVGPASEGPQPVEFVGLGSELSGAGRVGKG